MENANLTLDQKMELATWIFNNNNYVAIGGSLFLHRLGINLGRECDDIDVIVPPDMGHTFWQNLVLPPLCEEIEIETDDDNYPIAARYDFLGTKIEFLESSSGSPSWRRPTDKFIMDSLLEAKKEYISKPDCHPEAFRKHANDIRIIEEFLKDSEEAVSNRYNIFNYPW